MMRLHYGFASMSFLDALIATDFCLVQAGKRVCDHDLRVYDLRCVDARMVIGVERVLVNENAVLMLLETVYGSDLLMGTLKACC